MSPELETFDQLLGGDLPLALIRGLFGAQPRFVRAMMAMLDAGEVRLLAADGTEVPRWRWREVLDGGACQRKPDEPTLSITYAGARRIA